MSYLFDTSALYGAAAEPSRLTPASHAAFAAVNAPRYLSAVSAYELANKHRLGKLTGFRPDEFQAAATSLGLSLLVITPEEALAAAQYESPHRDPWDRLLAAQARAHDVTIVSPDSAFEGLGAKRIR